ncbi:hypothetical protein AB205_0153990 [Aquarana catesbeiana]|uniref:G-protein coupled receptors family 1 profile domain-containing protein n=1 Tax=Aquarana catesbeiana TaxID=8400 RepID=A0A2G9RNW8_AQUCT|nr:hypothetical protein AB205_0153990 [Aquarana catesbeiana]
MYLAPHSNHSPEIDKTVSILYTAVTPMLNPIVYSIKNKDVINTVKYTMQKFSKINDLSMPYHHATCFLLFLVKYTITLSGNLLLITVVKRKPKTIDPYLIFLIHHYCQNTHRHCGQGQKYLLVSKYSASVLSFAFRINRVFILVIMAYNSFSARHCITTQL